MKQFSCGDVVPGCAAVFHALSVDELLEDVAVHARRDHAMTDISPSLLAAVSEHIISTA